jgi:tetratricopeptide (TPR) repeat protein
MAMQRLTQFLKFAGIPGLLLAGVAWNYAAVAQEIPPSAAETIPQEVAPDPVDVPEVPAVDAAELARERSERTQAIEEMQSEFGIYSPQLAEAYADFGAYYLNLGDYESAIAQYTSALQIARISYGLYGEEQLPVIQKLIEANQQRQDWEEVDKLQHLAYHISTRLYEIKDAPYLLAATAYGDWKLRVVKENLLQMNSRTLIRETEDLSAFYDKVIARLETESEASQEDLLQLLYGESIADISLARMAAMTPFTAFQGTVSQYVTETRCQNGLNSQGQVVRQCFSVQVENPRFRQSQQDAKQIAVTQYTREVTRSIDKLQAISAASVALTAEQRAALDSHIAELQTESIQLQRVARRRSLF